MNENKNDINRNSETNTGGGAYIGGSVSAVRDFAGRDINNIINNYSNAETQTTAPSDVCELLEKWISIATIYSRSHRLESIGLKKRHTRIGAPSVALSGVVGTSIFAAIQEEPQLRWILALLSIVAAALAALVTFYNFAERAASHRIASEEYEDVARRLEILKTSITAMVPTDWRNTLEGYSQRLEAIGRRVEIPNSMVVIKEEVREFKGMFESHTEIIKVPYPKLPRVGFPDELEHVFQFTQKDKAQ